MRVMRLIELLCLHIILNSGTPCSMQGFPSGPRIPFGTVMQFGIRTPCVPIKPLITTTLCYNTTAPPCTAPCITTLSSTKCGETTTTQDPNRCNFTICQQNQGAYTTRFQVQYVINNIVQAPVTSDALSGIGQQNCVIIPWYSKNITVNLEALGVGNFFTFATDYPDPIPRCTKCYVNWGTVGSPQWVSN